LLLRPWVWVKSLKEREYNGMRREFREERGKRMLRQEEKEYKER
jgi:hypothetical protein